MSFLFLFCWQNHFKTAGTLPLQNFSWRATLMCAALFSNQVGRKTSAVSPDDVYGPKTPTLKRPICILLHSLEHSFKKIHSQSLEWIVGSWADASGRHQIHDSALWNKQIQSNVFNQSIRIVISLFTTSLFHNLKSNLETNKFGLFWLLTDIYVNIWTNDQVKICFTKS